MAQTTGALGAILIRLQLYEKELSCWCRILASVIRSNCVLAIMLDLDPRHISVSRPVCFDGAEGGRYDEWSFQLVAYLTAVAPHSAGLRYVVADLPPDDEDDEGKKA